MSKEPASVPELNLADALQRGMGLRLDRRFAGVHRRIYSALAMLIMALTATGIALWSELRDLKADLARAKADADAIKSKLLIKKHDWVGWTKSSTTARPKPYLTLGRQRIKQRNLAS